jgi:hypothetical protein
MKERAINQTQTHNMGTTITVPSQRTKHIATHGQKKCKMFSREYMTYVKQVFSDQTGRFLTRSQRGNKYIMVMVKIDSNAILVEPITSRNNHKLARAYRVLMTRLQHAGIVPKKHILNNKVSEATKTIIKDKYKMVMELVPPRLPPYERSGGRHLKFQGSFLECIGRRGRGFSTFIMGPPPPTNRNNTQLVETIQSYTNGISRRALEWTI